MILASRIVSDVKTDFKGGSSLSLNWGPILRRAGQKLLKNLNPDTLKLRKAVYGGITKDQFIHFMPEDIAKPIALYKKDGTRSWSYMPPAQYFSKAQSDKFTVAWQNGERFLVVAHAEPGATLVIDDMDDITGMTGTATPAVNDRDYISGDAAVQATFTDVGLTLKRTLDTALDVTDYLRGTVFIPVNVGAAIDLSSITLKLKTDDSNYYMVSTAVDEIGEFGIDGWNYLRFSMENATTTGTPTDTNIASWELTITAATGVTVVCVIDRMTLQKSVPLYLEGYADQMFVSATDNTIISEPDVDADYVNLTEDVADIYHYEVCLLVEQAGNESKNREAKNSFSEQLARAYAQYYENHPSEELPLSYNIAPELNRDMGGRSGDWDSFRDTTANDD